MNIDFLGFLYAIAVAVGGIVGFVKAGSIPSLVSGLIFGIILGYGAYRLTMDSSDIYVSLGTTIILAVVMGIRFYSTSKFIPAGLIALISLIMVLKLTYQGLTSVNENEHRYDRNQSDIMNISAKRDVNYKKNVYSVTV